MIEPGGLDRRTFLAWTAGAAAALGLVAAGCSPADGDASSSTARPAGTAPTGTSPVGTAPADDPTAVATDAFLAGVPLLVTRRTMQTFAALAGTNTLLRPAGLGNPNSRLVVAPNHDTVYVLAILDLRDGPLRFTMPAIPDRYHVMQFMDAWMGGVGLLGTRTTGGRRGTWVLAPTGWDGDRPAGAQVLEFPTPEAMLLGRIRAVDDADAATAAAIGRQLVLEPLAGPPPAGTDPKAANRMGPAPGTPQGVGTNGAAAFDELGDALAANPPVTVEQRAAIDAAASLGIGAGLHPSADATVAPVLAAAVTRGLALLDDRRNDGATRVNGWDVNLRLGTADTDTGVAGRAVVARWFWGPVPAEEAVYPKLAQADDGQPLDGSKRYRLRFARDALPPVDGFWSITAYGDDMFLVPNAPNRYSLSGDTPGLVAGDDGSIELVLQHDPPAGQEANWLPVPDGPFHVIMRLYLPRPPVTDGSWSPPPMTVT